MHARIIFHRRALLGMYTHIGLQSSTYRSRWYIRLIFTSWSSSSSIVAVSAPSLVCPTAASPLFRGLTSELRLLGLGDLDVGPRLFGYLLLLLLIRAVTSSCTTSVINVLCKLLSISLASFLSRRTLSGQTSMVANKSPHPLRAALCAFTSFSYCYAAASSTLGSWYLPEPYTRRGLGKGSGQPTSWKP